MANQIVVSAGAKVRNLQDVIIGTSGVLTSLGFDVANGVPRLDVNGKILVSQLPNSVMEYKGTWNAATNTPTLVNGTGNQGDVYLCNVAGTVDFGAGPIAFVVGDQVIYSGSIWQRASGATGTVTSVAITESGDSLNITGSPITTSGTINIGFNGTNLQYVNGAGNLTTFPTLITSIGLSMPSAFSVANSPLTANGTIAVTGAGVASQYIRGDGSLATFPTIATEAQRLITEVYNETGATLTKGTVVYINGGHGNLPTITKAIATGDATSAQTYGIVQTDITNNNNGYVVVIGSLTDLDTSAYVEGTQLYLSSTTAGAWTSTKQYAPAHLVYVAIVTRSHPTQGVVEVRIQNGFEMDELHNVSAQTPLNNQSLFYNTSTSLWENKSIATALGYTPADDSLVVKLAGTQTITGVKNFNIGLTLQDGYYPTPATGYVGLGSNGSGITILTKSGVTVYNNNLQFSNASNSYYFPNATGTIALTSDIPSLAGYVTLATTQTITGAKTFSGYTTFTSTVDITSGLTFSNSGFTLLLQPPTLSVNRTVTFADITGTIAMLEGTQTFTGTKTFNANPSINTGGQSSLSILSSTGNSALIFGYVNNILKGTIDISATEFKFASAINSTFKFQASGLGIASLIFDNTTNYSYTFPAASGTIALVGGSGVGTVTSVAALTLGTTGTDLSSTVANSTTTPVITLNVPTASATNRGALSSADWTTFNNKQGTITLTTTGTSGAATFTSNTLNIPNYGSALSGYLPLTGGTLTGALSGTSATFSGGVTSNATTSVSFYSGTYVSNTLGDGSFATYSGRIRENASFNLNIDLYDRTAATWRTPLSFNNTGGAATFSSSVTATSMFVNTTDNSSGAKLQVFGSINFKGNSGYNGWIISQTGGSASAAFNLSYGAGGAQNVITAQYDTGNVGIGTSSPTSNYGFERNLTISSTNNAELQLVQTGNSNYLSIGITNGINYFQSTNAYDFQIGGGSKMRITSGGNVLIGTTTDAGGKLQVNGEIRMYGSTLFRGMSSNTLQLCGGTSSSNVKIDGSVEVITMDTNGATRLTITSTGNVGIGTSSPSVPLEVYSTTADVTNNPGNSQIRASASSTKWLSIGYDGANNVAYLQGAENAVSWRPIVLNLNGTTTSPVLIGQASSDGVSKLQVTGAATFSSSVTATSFFESSDSRLKTLIQDNYQTKGIASITPKLYTKNGKVELGYYAQDFVGILDSAVVKGSDDMLSLSYREVLVAKVYALEQRIKELETK